MATAVAPLSSGPQTSNVAASKAGFEVWAYDGTTWSQVPTQGTAPNALGPATYDPVRHRIVGIDRTDVWEFDGVSWTKITPAAQPVPTRRGFDLAFDDRGRLYVSDPQRGVRRT